MRSIPAFLTTLGVLSGCADTGPLGPVPDLADPSTFAYAQQLVPGAPGTATVMTRNLYLGGDITPLLGATDPVAAATAIWNQIQYTNFPARARELASEIANARPDVVALQEAVRFTVGPFPSTAFPETVLIDYLSVLQAQLAALGQVYTVAVFQANTRVAVPIPMGTGLSTIGYQDGLAILVRQGVETANPVARRYAAIPPTAFTAGIPFLRGWTEVDARIGEGWVRVVNTHLEIQSFAPIQEAQTAELLASIENSPHPVILAGDFNSAANPSAPADRKTRSYQMILDAGFSDLWTRHGAEEEGLTCCHVSNLGNAAPTFDQRLDIVFARNKRGNGDGYAGAAFAEVVGGSAEDRFTGPHGYSLWPSDHAGVVATLRMPPGLFAER